MPKPPFGDEKEQGQCDEQEAQNTGSSIVGSPGHLLEHGVGECLIAEEGDCAKIRDDIEDDQCKTGDD
jgi:hypothetical protein